MTGTVLIDERNFPKQLEMAQTAVGSDYTNSITGMAFAEYGLSKGFGVQIMEAYGTGSSRGRHAAYHMILGVDDDGYNWADHKDPTQALQLVKEKFASAQEDSLELRYKFWMCPGVKRSPN